MEKLFGPEHNQRYYAKIKLAPSMYNGVAYFPNLYSARVVADKVSGRVIEYGRGFAVQYWTSGPYYPAHEMK